MSEKGVILIVDDTPTNLKVLVETLTGADFRIFVATDGQQALERVAQEWTDLVLLDVMMPPGIDGFEVCRRLKEDPDTQDIPVIFMTSLIEADDKVRGFQTGGVDYVPKPFQHEEVLARVRTHLALWQLQRNLEQQVAERTAELSEANTALQDALSEVETLKDRFEEENVYLQEEIRSAHNFEEIIGQSPAMVPVLGQIEQVAPTDATVLILGETDTGKELLARAVHNLSGRKDRPLVKVNCAALSANLIESELFGHEKGAFTGATERKTGRFELADGGTIFLDEIGDLPLEIQVKLLRVLQEGEFERLGSSDTLTVDVRVIAATNRDLETAVAEGAFREDLYYRLNVVPIRSIPLLVNHFVQKFSARLGKEIQTVPRTMLEALQGYSWPGNVRELENMVERTVVLSRGNRLELGDWLPKDSGLVSSTKTMTLEENERRYIREVLEQTSWRVSGEQGAAKILDMNPNTLVSRMRKLGIQRETD